MCRRGSWRRLQPRERHAKIAMHRKISPVASYASFAGNGLVVAKHTYTVKHTLQFKNIKRELFYTVSYHIPYVLKYHTVFEIFFFFFKCCCVVVYYDVCRHFLLHVCVVYSCTICFSEHFLWSIFLSALKCV